MGPSRLAVAIAVVVGLVASCSAGHPDPPAADPTGTPPASATTPVTTSDPVTTSAPVTTGRPPEPAADPCEGLVLGSPMPISPGGALTEISGAVVATSDQGPPALWVHQDSGHPAVLTRVGLDGTVLGEVAVAGVDPVDWEDLAAATDSGGVRHLFVADTGDNRRMRPHVEIVRLPEPPSDLGRSIAPAHQAAPPREGIRPLVADVAPATVAPAVVRLHHPGGPADVEALLVDPASADLVLLTKEPSGTARVLVAPGAAWLDDADVALEDRGRLRLGPGQAVLAADLSPDGTLVGLRTPWRVLLWSRSPDRSVAETLLSSEPCHAPAPFDIFGEALALSDDGYVLVGESDAPALQLVRRILN